MTTERQAFYEDRIGKCMRQILDGLNPFSGPQRIGRRERIAGGMRGIHVNLLQVKEDRATLSRGTIRKTEILQHLLMPFTGRYFRSLEQRHPGLRFRW